MKLHRTSLLARAYRLGTLADACEAPVSLCQLLAVVVVGLPVMAVFLGVFSIVAAPFFLLEALVEWWRTSRGAPAPRQPWALLEWLRAKKRRVCPLVEFED